MHTFLVHNAISVTQQMGAAAALGGVYVVVFFMWMLAILIAASLLIWGIWRYVKAKQGKPRKPLSPITRIVVTVLAAYPTFIGVNYLSIVYSNYQTDQARKAETVRRYTELETAHYYGELLIPAGTLINRGDPHNFKNLPLQDPLLDLETVRFTVPTQIAGVSAHAMSVEGSSLTIELAQDYLLDTPELKRFCPAGYVLMFPYPNRRITETQRLTPPYDWFTPSAWQPTTCFESTNGIMVMHVNQHGIYFPKEGKPYQPPNR